MAIKELFLGLGKAVAAHSVATAAAGGVVAVAVATPVVVHAAATPAPAVSRASAASEAAPGTHRGAPTSHEAPIATAPTASPAGVTPSPVPPTQAAPPSHAAVPTPVHRTERGTSGAGRSADSAAAAGSLDTPYLGPPTDSDPDPWTGKANPAPEDTTGGISNWVTLANKTCTGTDGNWTLGATVVFSDGHTLRLPPITSTGPYVMDLHIDPGYKGRNDFNATNSTFDMCPGAFGN